MNIIRRYPNAVKAVFCSLFGIFVAFLLAIAIFTKFTPAYDVMHSLGTDIYIAPWTRVLPYLIGVAAGYAMYTFNGVMPLGEVNIILSIEMLQILTFIGKKNFTFYIPIQFIQKTIRIVWSVMITIAVCSHISTINRQISHIWAAPLITFIRVFYPASIAWMIVASHTGHGGLFAKLLNFPVFVHVNKLSYAIYLLNPAVISVLYGWQDHSTHIDPPSMVCVFIKKYCLPPCICAIVRQHNLHFLLYFRFQTVMTTGIKVIVYLTAIVFSLVFEIPYTNLSTKLLKLSRKSSVKQTIPSEQIKKSL